MVLLLRLARGHAQGQMTNRLVGKSNAMKLDWQAFDWLNKREWLKCAENKPTKKQTWSRPGLGVFKHTLWRSKVCAHLFGRPLRWSSDNPLLSAANEVQRAKERVNRREGGLKQWLLHLIQHGFWGMKHAQHINDFLLFSPVSSRAWSSLQTEALAPDRICLSLLTYKRDAIIWRQILGAHWSGSPG